MWAVRDLAGRPRLLVSALVGIAVFVLLWPGSLRPSTRGLLAWDAFAGLYLILAGAMAARSGAPALRRRAGDIEDAGATAVLALTVLAAVMSIGGIFAELQGFRSGKGEGPTLRLSLAAATILLSWLFVQTIFALHYAHDYYGGPTGERGGLAFPGEATERDPDYWDFLYFALTIGAASQTSDVTIVSHRTRRFVLAQTVLSFLFNTTVLALAINVGASLLQG